MNTQEILRQQTNELIKQAESTKSRLELIHLRMNQFIESLDQVGAISRGHNEIYSAAVKMTNQVHQLLTDFCNESTRVCNEECDIAKEAIQQLNEI